MKTHTKPSHFNKELEYFKSQQYTLAISHATKHLKLHPNHKESLKLCAYIEFQQNHFPEALDYLSKIILSNQADAEIYNLIGCVFLEASDYTQSIQYLYKSIEEDRKSIDAYTNLALALQKNNQTQDAISVCEEAIKIAPTSINILKQYSKSLFSAGDYQDSCNAYLSWLKLESNSISANTGLAKCYLALNQKTHVIELLDKLKNTDTRSPLIRLDVTNELLKQGETEYAIDSYLNLVDDLAAKENIYNNIASAYDQQGDPKKAIIYFKKAIKENEKYTPAYSNIGRVYTDLQQFEEAKNR